MESNPTPTQPSDQSKPTILLIHGAFASSTWWDLVTPHLPTYHILAPNLPGHGPNTSPFTIQSAVDSLASLITNSAHNSQAHIVGHSLGASIAIHLATQHPDLALSVFVSGYGSLPKTFLTPYLPYAAWMVQRVENMLPRSLIRWAMGADLPRTESSLRLCREVIAPENEISLGEPWPAKTLIVVAGKGGVIPSADSRDSARRLLDVGRMGNEGTIAVVHVGMRHPWNRQEPGLFAEAVRAWIEGRELPGRFEGLGDD